ncbi:MAG: alpha/beta fold hydrolase [Anaerolineae bacterium]|nr:alpha/beta fold hydrolase [Phycisphaerae bacterium]
MMRLIFLLHALLFGMSGCAERFLLFPSTQTIDAQGAQRIEVKPAIEVWTDRSLAAKEAGRVDAYVLEFTGNATRAEQITRSVAGRWQPHRVEVWVMNYPGFGGSAGPAKLRAIPPAALAVYDELKCRAGDKPIFVCGNSLGGAVALCVAARRPVAGMILQNPPALRQIILGEHGWWNLWLFAGPIALAVPNELDAIANASNVRAPVIFISADADTLVPLKYQDKIAAKYRGPVGRIHLKNAGHWQSMDQLTEIEVLNKAIDWLVNATAKP